MRIYTDTHFEYVAIFKKGGIEEVTEKEIAVVSGQATGAFRCLGLIPEVFFFCRCLSGTYLVHILRPYVKYSDCEHRSEYSV